MPLARIVTRAVEESQELAADLRGRGFDVEIVTPNAIPKTQADVELRLEECTPEEALIRAGVLPETNDLAVFIAPGAIANRRERIAAPAAPQFSTQRKWYDSISDATATPSTILPFALKPLEENFNGEQIEITATARANEMAVPQQAELALQATAIGEEVYQEVHHGIVDSTLVDLNDEPLFAEVPAVAASEDRPSVMPSVKSVHVAVPTPTQVIAEAMETKPVADARLGARLGAPRRNEPIRMAMPPSTKPAPTMAWRRVRIPALTRKSPWHISKTAAGFAAGAVLMLVLGAWMFRKGPVPAEMGATAEDAHQAAPFTDNRTKPATPSPSALGSATPGVPERSETYSSGIVPQAAAAITPIPSPKKVTTPKRAPVKSGPSDDIVARDTVTRFAAHTVKSPPKPKSKPAKPTNDGIKRYSDLD